MPVTNKGKARVMNGFFRAQSIPTTFYAALVTSATAPTVDTNTFGQLSEVPAGNGYTAGGIAVARNTTDFPTLTEDDTNDLAELVIKNLQWTASGGTLPASGNGARYMIITDDNATQSNREVLAWFDLNSDVKVSDGQPLSINTAKLRLLEPA